MEQLGPHWTKFHKIRYWGVFLKICRGNEVLIKIWQEQRVRGDDQYTHTFLIISLSVLLRRRNVTDKSCRENRNTFYTQYILFRKSCRIWDNVEKYCRAGEAKRPQMTIWRMRIACWITKATNKRSEYVTFNSFFPLQQWLHERASVLCYEHLACIVWRCVGLAREISYTLSRCVVLRTFLNCIISWCRTKWLSIPTQIDAQFSRGRLLIAWSEVLVSFKAVIKRGLRFVRTWEISYYNDKVRDVFGRAYFGMTTELLWVR
jgi:hypothetical protein